MKFLCRIGLFGRFVKCIRLCGRKRNIVERKFIHCTGEERCRYRPAGTRSQTDLRREGSQADQHRSRKGIALQQQDQNRSEAKQSEQPQMGGMEMM